MTDTTLDLGRAPDRLYMNSFISEVGTYLEAISKAEKKAEKLITETQNKSVEKTAAEFNSPEARRNKILGSH